MSDATMAKVARDLAEMLILYAHDRRDDDKKEIASLHRQLCIAYRDELREKKGEPDAQS